ncbi:MAG: NAD+ synthase [Parachlamydiaceae bacterium]
MRIYLAQINPTIGAIDDNIQLMLDAIEQAKQCQAELVVFPELAVTGYPPEDFLLLHSFSEKTERALNKLIAASKGIGVIAGTIRRNPEPNEKPLFNTAAILYDGKLLGYQDKALLPTYDVFDEWRYFEPAHKPFAPWVIGPYKVAVTICEDIWKHAGKAHYARDPILELAKHPVDLLVNLSASPYHAGKINIRLEIGSKAAQTLKCPVALTNQIGGNDSLIFDGHSYLMNSKGKLSYLSKSFSEDGALVDTEKAQQATYVEDRNQELYQALVLGLKDYFKKSGFKTACLGLSGGIDSALVACLAVDALGKDNILACAMPSRYSSRESIEDASILAKNLGIKLQVIPIEDPFDTYLKLLTPYFAGKPQNTTEENLQARIRGIILMAISNKHGHIVLSTGNKSELAMGYCTLYGDMTGGLAVISDLTKEQVYALSRWINRTEEIIPQRIIDKPPSAELRPDQKDSDSLPPYPTVDAVLIDYIEKGLSPEEISQKNKLSLPLVQELIRKIHQSEYKRRQAPPGLRISEKAFSIGRRFPIVQRWVT